MRTTERTLDALRAYRVPSPSEMQDIVLDLQDLVELRLQLAEAVKERDAALAMTKRPDGPCYYCGERTQRHAGNPNKWPIYLCHSDELGVAKPHHVGCVSKRLLERDELRAEVERLKR